MIKPKYETTSRNNKRTRPSPAARKRAYQAVATRADGLCEGCHVKPAEQIHHRLYRSRGGEDTETNCLHLCLGCHQDAHTLLGEQRGWSVKRRNDPAVIPYFRLSDGLWRHVTEPGVILNPIDAMQIMALHNQVVEGMPE